jgi:hypothetical protein
MGARLLAARAPAPGSAPTLDRSSSSPSLREAGLAQGDVIPHTALRALVHASLRRETGARRAFWPSVAKM